MASRPKTFEGVLTKWEELLALDAKQEAFLLLRYIQDCDMDRVGPSGEFREDVCTKDDLNAFFDRVSRKTCPRCGAFSLLCECKGKKKP